MYYLTKLKNLLQYKYIALLLLIILLSMIRCNNFKSIYNKNDTIFYGEIEEYQIKDTYVTFIVKGKEKLKCNYYLKNNNNIKLNYGDKLYLKGTLKPPNNNTIPNTFNYKKYLKNKKIFYILEVDKIIKKNKTNKIIYKIKNILKKRLDKYDTTGYLNAFILGNKNNLDKDSYDNYLKNGIIHIFSISGMHISLLASIILSILNKIKKTNNNIIIVIIFLIFYLILTNYQASIIRSIIFYINIQIFKLKKINIKKIDALLISLSIILLFLPEFIYDIGFQYSSIVSISLLYFKNKFNKNYILNLLYVSFISFLISFPITVNLNYQVNLLSIFINLIFVPLVSFILYPLSIITFIIPILNPLFNKLMNITEFISNYISLIKIMNISIPKLNTIFIIIYYILVYISLTKNKKYFLILILYILFIKNINLLDNNYYVYYLDVKQGDMSLIKYKDECIVIDTGPNNKNYNIIDNHIKFMHSIGINNIDLLIISHGDSDHIGNAKYLVNNFKVNKVSFNIGNNSDLEKDLIKVLKNKNIFYTTSFNKENKKIKYYYLNTKEYNNENDNSSVIYLLINKYKFLFMGDASAEREKDILSKYNLNNIDFIKVGHHGSNTSSSEYFINNIKPQFSIISVGKNNKYGHPKKEVLDTLKNNKIYRTDLNGSIKVKINKNAYKIKTFSP